MNYGRIRRGPMAADAFTQIRNSLFRDSRLSFRDKGIFGLISTHADGFGVSAEAIAACSPTDGVTGVKTSLRNLEKHGYLRRTRERNTDGTLGASVYFITDDPTLFPGTEEPPAVENCRSEPAGAQPPVAEPTVGQPTVAEPAVAEPAVGQSTHKKNNSKKTILEKNISLSPAPSEPAPAAGVDGEREIHDGDDTAKVAEAWATARGGARIPSAEREVRRSAAELLAGGWLLPDVIALAEDMARRKPQYTDLGTHARHWQPPAPATGRRMIVADTHRTRPECPGCDRPLRHGAPEGLCVDCRAEHRESA